MEQRRKSDECMNFYQVLHSDKSVSSEVRIEGEQPLRLVNLAFYDRMCDETMAFNADIYHQDAMTKEWQKIGTCSNGGRGASTDWYADEGKRELLEHYEKVLNGIDHDYEHTRDDGTVRKGSYSESLDTVLYELACIIIEKQYHHDTW